MAKDKPPTGTKQNTMDKYTQLTTTTGVTSQGDLVRDNTVLFAAITQSHDAKIEEVGMYVNLLHHDLRKAVDRITEAETRVSGVQDSVASLKQTVMKLMMVTNVLTLTQRR
ncbi:hypothetical protein NDU88_001720 [Pleurodeles waltl]|uniref:Uncharacterized protein n=1 Tax=Pleurodeles waltl TaxID=8319 RepID=A0AAV7UWT6_PLEWA|nr:hypothetical protein NDU88_001720 [Pleurodeles waltl]